MDFGAALSALKSGGKIARQGWNGKNMFIYLNKGSVDSSSNVIAEFVEGCSVHLFDNGDVGTITRMPNLNMKAASGSTITGWLASQTDILAEDWMVLP